MSLDLCENAQRDVKDIYEVLIGARADGISQNTEVSEDSDTPSSVLTELLDILDRSQGRLSGPRIL